MAKRDKRSKTAEQKGRAAAKQLKKTAQKEKKGKSKGGTDSDAEDVDLESVLEEYAKQVTKDCSFLMYKKNFVVVHLAVGLADLVLQLFLHVGCSLLQEIQLFGRLLFSSKPSSSKLRNQLVIHLLVVLLLPSSVCPRAARRYLCLGANTTMEPLLPSSMISSFIQPIRTSGGR